ncbi:MAG TPA: pyridoxamine 5'-phosphate oxidase family protein [Steroidobacteraceae bacterium]|nr:pyridoxamine 5'-phosphate oxidase family protein [Steroidobacteraceae bacterium]
MSEPETLAELAPRRGQLRRADKIMSTAELDALLGAAFCGRTATVDKDGYPYVMPNLFIWQRGQVYLHTTLHAGHFLDNVRHADRVCFEVDEPGEVFPYGEFECDTTISYRSAVIFGRIRIVEEEPEKIAFFAALMAKYAPADSWGRKRGSFPRVAATIVYAITPESMTGKQGVLPAPAARWPMRTRAPGDR